MEHCPWCLGNEKMIRYHDEEWGVPVHDDRKQFEFLMMEVMQCGLNWDMMIQNQKIFQNCSDNYDFDKVVAYSEADIERLMDTNGMIRSRRKLKLSSIMPGAFRKYGRNLVRSASISALKLKQKDLAKENQYDEAACQQY